MPLKLFDDTVCLLDSIYSKKETVICVLRALNGKFYNDCSISYDFNNSSKPIRVSIPNLSTTYFKNVNDFLACFTLYYVI